MVVVESEANLPKIVRAAHPIRRFPHSHHRRHDQANQGANDGEDDQQLDERKAAMPYGGVMHGPPLKWKATAESPGRLVGWVESSRPTEDAGGSRRLDPPRTLVGLEDST